MIRYALLLMLLAVPAFGQSFPPTDECETPTPECIASLPEEMTVTLYAPKQSGATVRMKLLDTQNQKHVFDLPVPKRTADRAYWLWTAAMVGTTVLDIENTQYLLRHGGQEANPIFGNHPSRLRAYGIVGPIDALAAWLTWREKRENEAARAFGAEVSHPHWWLADAMVAGGHVFGTVFTVAATGR